MSTASFQSDLASFPMNRRRFMAAGAAGIGSGALASSSSRPKTNAYIALVVGTIRTEDPTLASWLSEPSILNLHHAPNVQDALRIIKLHCPDLLMLTDATTSHGLLATAAQHGLRGVYMNTPQLESPVLAASNRIIQKHGIKAATTDPIRLTKAYAALADRVQSGAIGRTLEIRCAIQGPPNFVNMHRCRQSVAMALAWGAIPRSCHGRLYSGAERMGESSTNSLKRSEGFSADTAFHASISHQCGLTCHLDCNCTNREGDASVTITWVGTRGNVQLVNFWPSSAQEGPVGGQLTIQSAFVRHTPVQKERSLAEPTSEKEIARAALQDLIISIEQDRSPISSLADYCFVDNVLRSAVESHCLQRHVSLSAPRKHRES